MSMQVATSFLVLVHRTGGVSVLAQDIPGFENDHTVSIEEIEMYSSHVAKSAGRALLVDALKPAQPPSVSDQVTDALRKRRAD